MHKINEKAIAFLPVEDIEFEALDQIVNTSKMPFIYKHVAVMPDCHCGKGATVGTVVATDGAIMPAAVGVDIGCGMISVRTNLKRSDLVDLHAIRVGIEQAVPMSAGNYNSRVSKSARVRIKKLEEHAELKKLDVDKFWNWREQLGTLGGWNHFIEVCTDETDGIWITVHSGSRGVGNKIGNHYIKKAQELCDSMLIKLPDRDLAYIPQTHELFKEYMDYLHWAQDFALLNREEMMERVIGVIQKNLNINTKIETERINCHHNFTQIENHFGKNVWVTRKGAIKADITDRGMIPWSMGAKSYIISGLANKMSFNSAPHGAGRKFSRGKAKELFTMEDFAREMEGIEHRSEKVLLDEIPSCYKDIDVVMENAKTLVKIDHVLKQIINVKGD